MCVEAGFSQIWSHLVFDINSCSFIDNKGAKSIIYIEKSIEYMNSNITFTDSFFHGNEGTCIVLINEKLHFNGNTLFENNRGNQGPGMYISENSTIIFGQNSNVLLYLFTTLLIFLVGPSF